MLDGIKWQPATKNGEPINSKVNRIFNFMLIEPEEKGYNILAPKVYPQKVH